MRRELLGLVVALKIVGLVGGAAVASALPLATGTADKSGETITGRMDAAQPLGSPLDPERSVPPGLEAPSADGPGLISVRPVPIPSSAALFGSALIAVAWIGLS